MNGLFHTLPGGKGANVSMVAKRLGADVSLHACVGEDVYADIALRTIRKEGVDLSCVNRLESEATGVAFINVSDDGENQIAVASGANVAFEGRHLTPIKADAIITQFEIPSEVILEAISDNDAFICLNASPVGPKLSLLLPHINLLIVNEGEYAAYESELESYQGMLAITLGSRGARLVQKSKTLAEAEPPSVEVVDTTGAGDSFAAALMLAFLEGKDPQKALEFAVVVGSLATTKLGTQSAAPFRADVNKLI